MDKHDDGGCVAPKEGRERVLWDRFAGLALEGMLSNQNWRERTRNTYGPTGEEDAAAKWAYRFAAAMIRQRRMLVVELVQQEADKEVCVLPDDATLEVPDDVTEKTLENLGLAKRCRLALEAMAVVHIKEAEDESTR